MDKIGIMGGTFDPIHIGHLMLADQTAKVLGFAKVLFIPTGRPPHKDARKISPAAQRIDMVKLAIEGNDLYEVHTAECDNPGVSYTYETLSALRAQYGPDVEFYYIIGSDVLPNITKFINFRQVLDSCVITVSSRPGADHDMTETMADDIIRLHGARIRLVDFPEIAISSSMLRGKIAAGESVRYMLPDAVIEYIKANGLYKEGGDTVLPGYWESIPQPAGHKEIVDSVATANASGNETVASILTNAAQYKHLQPAIKKRLSNKRYEHTLGVASTARKLAETFGADPEKAALAGLLHDCMRDFPPDELIRWCESNNIELTDFERLTPILLHSRAGATEAAALLGRTDHEIEEAIACHTTGRENMGLLAKIIFVADGIEPGRDYDAAVRAREMLREKTKNGAAIRVLDKVILYLLENQIIHIVETGRSLHPDTVNARNWLLREANKM